MKIKLDPEVLRKTQSLKDITKVEVNNENCVIFSINSQARMDKLKLMSFGCFDGNEEYIRITKVYMDEPGRDFSYAITTWNENDTNVKKLQTNTTYSDTCLSVEKKMLAKTVIKCAEDHGILLIGSRESILENIEEFNKKALPENVLDSQVQEDNQEDYVLY